jgi:cytochrome c553
MKKLLWIAVPGTVAVLLLIFGPALLDFYRLDRYIANSSKAYQADGGPWPHLSDVCVMCHGVKGNSPNQGYPSLAGQPSAYLDLQLHNFASGERRSPNMDPLAMNLSEPEVKLLSEYFARQTIIANSSFRPDPALREKGRLLAEKLDCASCHGVGMRGHDQYPRLVDQGYDYLLEQLSKYADGQRIDRSGVMKALSSGLSAEERQALATYLASFSAAPGPSKT